MGSAGEGLEAVLQGAMLGLARSLVEGTPYLLSTWVQTAPFFGDCLEVVGRPGKWKVVLWWKVDVEVSGELHHTLEVVFDQGITYYQKLITLMPFVACVQGETGISLKLKYMSEE